MACKVIAAGQESKAQPLFARRPRVVEALPAVPTNTGEGASAHEIRALKDRIAELEAALDRETRKAREVGKAEGELRARDAAQAEITPVIERLTRSIGELAGLRTRIRRESEQDLVRLSVCIAKRILRREVGVDPDAIHGLVRAALDKVHAKELRKIRVHPDFHATVRHHLDASGLGGSMEVAADPSLQAGDVIVETRLGDLDASVDSQLAEIERGFADRLGR